MVDGPVDGASVDGLVDEEDGGVDDDVLVVITSSSNPSNETQSTLLELPSTPIALLIAELEISSWPFTQFKINNVKKINREIIFLSMI